MSYPKQEGFIPAYNGVPPIDLVKPETLVDALKQGDAERTNYFIENPTEPDEINKPGFNGQQPIHLACFRGDKTLGK